MDDYSSHFGQHNTTSANNCMDNEECDQDAGVLGIRWSTLKGLNSHIDSLAAASAKLGNGFGSSQMSINALLKNTKYAQHSPNSVSSSFEDFAAANNNNGVTNSTTATTTSSPTKNQEAVVKPTFAKSAEALPSEQLGNGIWITTTSNEDLRLKEPDACPAPLAEKPYIHKMFTELDIIDDPFANIIDESRRSSEALRSVEPHVLSECIRSLGLSAGSAPAQLFAKPPAAIGESNLNPAGSKLSANDFFGTELLQSRSETSQSRSLPFEQAPPSHSTGHVTQQRSVSNFGATNESNLLGGRSAPSEFDRAIGSGAKTRFINAPPKPRTEPLKAPATCLTCEHCSKPILKTSYLGTQAAPPTALQPPSTRLNANNLHNALHFAPQNATHKTIMSDYVPLGSGSFPEHSTRADALLSNFKSGSVPQQHSLTQQIQSNASSNNSNGGPPRVVVAHSQATKLYSYCTFCKNNGESEAIYSTHYLKDANGIVTCPILRAYTCPICGQNGDKAHTVKYCPIAARLSPKEAPVRSEMRVLRTARTSAGRRRFF